jgi:hypothetical protein
MAAAILPAVNTTCTSEAAGVASSNRVSARQLRARAVDAIAGRAHRRWARGRWPRRSTRRTLGRWVALLAVGLGLLPSVMPFDHLIPIPAEAHAAAAAHTHPDAVHVSHCHLSPGTCSDAPVPAGPGQVLAAQPLLVVPALFAVLLVWQSRGWTARTVRPLLRPPLPVPSAA